MCLTVAILALGSVTTASSVATAQDAPRDSKLEEAKKHFETGVNLLDDPDGAKYEEAYHAFKKAYTLSQSPKVLGNLGFCAFHLERDGEAIDAYSAYLREVPDIDERERAQIQKDVATLSSNVATVRVVVKKNAGAHVLIDSRTQTRGPSVENSYPFEGSEIVIRVRPGRHTMKVKTQTEESQPFEVTLEPATTTFHEAVFVAKPPPNQRVVVRSAPSYAGPIILGITGVVAIGAGVTTGLLARSKTSDIENDCPDDVCPATYDLDGNKDTARTFGTVADISFIAGGALIAGAAVWYLLIPKERGTQAATALGGFRPAAMCTGVGCGVQLGRAF